MNRNENYIGKLEDTLAKFMKPVRDIPFVIAIKVLSGFAVLSFDKSSGEDIELLELLKKVASTAGERAYKAAIFTNRPNEAGNRIEPFVKEALNEIGLKADTPLAADGKRKAVGYPDIEIQDSHGRTVYLECKTYNIDNIDTTQRAFYFSPSENFKVTKDALHLMVSFQIEKESRGGRTAFVPVHWRLYTLEDLTVDIKLEFNQNNRKMYGSESLPQSLLAEGSIVI